MSTDETQKKEDGWYSKLCLCRLTRRWQNWQTLPVSDDAAAAALYRRFGAAVAGARRKTGKRQAELATALGLSRTSVANIEAGRQHPKLYLVYVIARELAVEINELLPAPNQAFWNPARNDERETVNIARASWLEKIKQVANSNEEVGPDESNPKQKISPRHSSGPDKAPARQARTDPRRPNRARSRD